MSGSADTKPILSNMAVYYHPEAFSINNSSRIMGRQSAGAGFLHGFFRQPDIDHYYCYSKTGEDFKHFSQQLTAIAPDKSAVWIPYHQPENLVQAGSVFLSGPGLGEHAWRRHRDLSASSSLIGITHTICSDTAMRAITDLVTAPVESWDALICTSDAVKKAVEKILEGWESSLSRRLSVKISYTRPDMPVIPLGVDCDTYAVTDDSQYRRQQFRQRNGIKDSDVVVLYFGRLSAHAKAHPLPMFVAIEAAARQTGKQTVLVLAGWAANTTILQGFIDGAKQLCPSVRVLIADARKPEVPPIVWAGADIFCSLSDNIQESFGLTPVEAQAAGLPVVVSDWDGYRDTVEEGVTGFRVPTIMPGDNSGEELAWRYLVGTDNYDQYVARVSQCIAVDIRATTHALVQLIGNAGLRQRMGTAGRARARLLYDWKVVIQQYQLLRNELADRRKHALTVTTQGNIPRVTSPQYADPFTIFSFYPSRTLEGSTLLSCGPAAPLEVFRTYISMEMNRLGSVILASEADTTRLLERILNSRQIAVNDLLLDYPQNQHPLLKRTICWLIKLGIVTV